MSKLIKFQLQLAYNGRGAIREDHPLSIGRIGEFTPSYSRNLIEFADVIVALGYRFTDVSTEGWKIASQCKIIQVDIDPLEIGKNVRADVGILGNMEEVFRVFQESSKIRILRLRNAQIG